MSTNTLTFDDRGLAVLADSDYGDYLLNDTTYWTIAYTAGGSPAILSKLVERGFTEANGWRVPEVEYRVISDTSFDGCGQWVTQPLVNDDGREVHLLKWDDGRGGDGNFIVDDVSLVEAQRADDRVEYHRSRLEAFPYIDQCHDEAVEAWSEGRVYRFDVDATDITLDIATIARRVRTGAQNVINDLCESLDDDIDVDLMLSDMFMASRRINENDARDIWTIIKGHEQTYERYMIDLESENATPPWIKDAIRQSDHYKVATARREGTIFHPDAPTAPDRRRELIRTMARVINIHSSAFPKESLLDHLREADRVREPAAEFDYDRTRRFIDLTMSDTYEVDVDYINRVIREYNAAKVGA